MTKKKKATKGAKSLKVKLPKEIAGVKLGKDLRQAVEPVMRWANHPMVSETLATALLAGATALADDKTRSKAARAASASAAAAAGAGAQAASRLASEGSRVGLALAVADGEIASRIVATYEQGAGRPKARKAGTKATKAATKARKATTKARKPAAKARKAAVTARKPASKARKPTAKR